MSSFNEVVGVAGCGTMGLPMAEVLFDAGIQTYGHDVRPIAEFGRFAPRMLADAGAFAARCDVVISVVRDVQQTLDLCFGEQGVFTREDRPLTLVVSSTLSPRFIIELRAQLDDAVELVDAPMSGAPIAARERRLSFMLGGDPTVLGRLMPLFDVMGQRIFTLGPLGQGMTAKVLNNYVAGTSVVAVRRAYARAQALGMDVEALRDVMSASSGSTWFGDKFHDIDWSFEGYATGNTVAIVEKDIRASLDAIESCADVAADAFDEALLSGLKSLEPYQPNSE